MVVEREQAFAELEAAKTFADAHHGCCLTCEERMLSNLCCLTCVV